MSAVIDAELPESPANRGAALTAADIETNLVDLLAGVLKAESESIAVDSHFFEELGADSLVMAHFCARIRKQGSLPSVSMRDIYRYPTIGALAASLADTASAGTEPSRPAPARAATPTSSVEQALCGVAQLLIFVSYLYISVVSFRFMYAWIYAGSGFLDMYSRFILGGAAALVVVGVIPIVAKWTLIGRAKPTEFRIWSPTYLRFWIVKTLIRANPLALLFIGTPIYLYYLRALGAKIGPGVTIFSNHVPVCPDLLTIGANTVIRKEVFFNCYRANAGRIETGTVTLGRDVLVGEQTKLDIDTSMGDGSQLGYTSALHRGQAVPAGERWHGSPAQRTDVDYQRVAPVPCGRVRRASFTVAFVLFTVLVSLPLSLGGLYLLAAIAPSLGVLVSPGAPSNGIGALQELVFDALAFSAILFFGFLLFRFSLALTIPRVLNLFLTPYEAYPLYGFHDAVHRWIVKLTNPQGPLKLFGDSSYVVNYLLWLGYKLKPVEQTGSNFGTAVKQANPFLCSVGTGTMIADGLTVINEEVSSTSFCVTRVSIGKESFFGNAVNYPGDAMVGDNCLLATKVMVPLDGELREGVGLLGSPSFEIPRTVDRDTRFDHLRTGEDLRRGLAAKNRNNLRTMGLFLLARWMEVFVMMFWALAAFELYDTAAHMATAGLLAAGVIVNGFFVALTDASLRGFRPLEPKACSIYDPGFWLHERLWKVTHDEFLAAFNGTPFKTLFWRLLGLRIGKRVFDDGLHLPERTLTSIGDDCTLNEGCGVQCHSEEDGTFKADRTAIGSGCTIGVGALVHYGVTMGDGAVLAIDSFLMKGEEVPAGARWGGNPAREMEVK